jgi:coenzyme Q-binding protein COQ10
MPNFSQSKILPHKAEDIFNLVMDIEKYPEFLPWCKSAQINEKISKNNLKATLLISFKGFMEKYKSDVNFGKNKSGFFIDVKAIEGPFKKLTNNWVIEEIDENSCHVKLDLDFEFNSIILSKLIGLIFAKACQKMVSAFEERALELSKKQ